MGNPLSEEQVASLLGQSPTEYSPETFSPQGTTEITPEMRGSIYDGEREGYDSYWDNLGFMYGQGFKDTFRGIKQLTGVDDEEADAEDDRRAERLWDEGYDMKAAKMAGYLTDPAMWMMPWGRIKQLVKGGQYLGTAAFGATAGAVEGGLAYDNPNDDLGRLEQAGLGAAGGAVAAPVLGAVANQYKKHIGDKVWNGAKSAEGVTALGGAAAGGAYAGYVSDEDLSEWRNWGGIAGAAAMGGASGLGISKLSVNGDTVADMVGRNVIPNYKKSIAQLMMERSVRGDNALLQQQFQSLIPMLSKVPKSGQVIWKRMLEDADQGELGKLMRQLDDVSAGQQMINKTRSQMEGGFIRDRNGNITGIRNKSGKADEVQQNKITEEYLNSKINSKEFAAKIDAELLEAWSKKPNRKGVKKGKEEDLKIMLKQYQTAMLKLGREAVNLGLLDPRKFKRNQLNYLAQKYTKNTDNNVFQRDAALLGTREVFNEFKELGKRIVVTPTSAGGADDAPRAIKLLNGQGDAGDSLTNYAKDYPESDIGLDFKMMRDRGMEPELEYANKLEQYDKVEGDIDGQVNFRRNWTGQEREEMGQINDIAYLVDSTFKMYGTALPKFQTLNRMTKLEVENPITGKTGKIYSDPVKPESARKAEGHTRQIPNSRNKFGDMAGKYVSPETYQDIMYATKLSKVDRYKNNPLVRKYRRVNALWKGVKTIYNPATHMNNTMSNIVMYNLGDGGSVELAKASGRLIRGVKDPLYKEAAKREVFGGHLPDTWSDSYTARFKDGDIRNPMVAMDMAVDNTGRLFGYVNKTLGKTIDKAKNGRIAKGMHNTRMAATKTYQAEDNVFRMAMFDTKVKELKRANPNWEMKDVYDEAARMSKSWFVDYDAQTPLLNFLREGPLPFASYLYGIVPRLTEVAITNPAKIFKWTVGVSYLNELGMELSDGELEELQRMQNMVQGDNGKQWWGLPVGAPNMLKIPTGWTQGDIEKWLAIGRMIPGGDIFGSADAGQLGKIPGVPNALQPSFGAAGGLYDIATGIDRYSGREIAPDQKWNALWKQFVPNLAYSVEDVLPEGWPDAIGIPGTFAMDKVKRANSGMYSPTRDQFTSAEANLSNTGIKITPLEKHKLHARINMRFQEQLRDLSIGKNKAFNDMRSGQISKDDYREYLRKYYAEKQAITAEKYKVIRGQG